MGLTAEQRAVVEHEARTARAVGRAGTGKTTALLTRYLRLVGGERASSVLVVCRNRTAAGRFRDSALPHLRGGFDALPITTVFGVAFDLLNRYGTEPVRLLSTAEQRHVVRRLLATEEEAGWPTLGHLVRRRAFVDHVASALIELQNRPEAMGAAGAGAGEWQELLPFAARYRAHLEGQGKVDSAGLMVRALAVLDDPEVLTTEQAGYRHVLVDDLEAASPMGARLVERLAGTADTVTVTGNPHAAVAGDGAALETFNAEIDVEFIERFRQPGPPSLVRCRHPSIEAEAIAGELLRQHDGGVRWSEMAVLVRSPSARARTVARALARHGIPVAPQPVAAAGDDPAVNAVIDVLRWIEGDGAAGSRLAASPLGELGTEGLAELHDRVQHLAGRLSTSELAFEVWALGFGRRDGHDGPDLPDSSLDAMAAFLDTLHWQSEADPTQRLSDVLAAVDASEFELDPWRVMRAADTADHVTVASITSAAGNEWHTVVIAGCTEGELPRISGRTPVFDPAVLDGQSRLAPAERRRESLLRERRLFGIACSRATATIVGTAAPQPGVLLSRFVEGWATRPPELPMALGGDPVFRPFTAGPAPVYPDAKLRLSASQLDTYDDCPLRYAYQYPLGARGEAGIPADLGSLVHNVLARFLDPNRPDGHLYRTRADLLAIADELWRDDIAPYRPQVEEARRDFLAMLDQWWAIEGEGPLAPDVLSVERWFDVEVGPHRLNGAIDRVDRVEGPDGGPAIRIVDYKTGKKEPPADEMPDNLQLAVYHLAATRDPELMEMGEPAELELMFLRSMHRFQQPIPDGHAAATEQRVLEAANRILDESFEPSVDANCRNCDFWRLCPLQPDGREVVDA